MNSLESPGFLQEDTITAKIGLRFGVNVLISGSFTGEIVNLKTRVLHPPFKEGGQIVDEWDSPMNIGITRYTGWHFESNSELVAGKWRFEILDDSDRLLASKDFNILIEGK